MRVCAHQIGPFDLVLSRVTQFVKPTTEDLYGGSIAADTAAAVDGRRRKRGSPDGRWL